MKRQTLAVSLFAVLVMLYLCFLLYFLTIFPGGPSGNPAVIWVLTGFASGGMFIMAVYMVTFYLFRRGEKAALYFALFCAGECVRFLIMDRSMTLLELIPGLTLNAVIAIRCYAIAFMVIGIVSFIFEVFAGRKHKKMLRYLNLAVIISFTAAAVSAIVMGEDTFNMRVMLFFVCMAVDAYCVYIVFISRLMKNRLYVLYLASLLFYAAATITVALLTDRIPHMGLVASTAFVIAHIVLLSDRYARAIGAVEGANLLLEQKVSERTAELSQAVEDLSASENSVRQAMLNISHDLKTPLTVMFANLEMIREDEPGSKAFRRHLDIAESHGKELARLIGGLREAAQAESPETQINAEWVSISALLNEAHRKYADTVEEAGLVFLIEYGYEAEVWIDRNKIWSIFGNIIGNALRYTKSGGVRIAAGLPENGFLTITFSDTGCGIAPESLPYIFDRQYRADPARAGSGSGLGLYIVKTGVERMGGGAYARSRVGEGTEIGIRLKSRKSGTEQNREINLEI